MNISSCSVFVHSRNGEERSDSGLTKTKREGDRERSYGEDTFMQPLLTIISVIKDPAEGFEQTRASVVQEFGDDPNVEHIIKEWSGDPDVREVPNPSAPETELRIRTLRGADDGVFHGMNQALEHAQGRWIVFLNAGDWFARNVGTALRQAMRENAGADYLFFDGVTVDSRDRREFLRKAPSRVRLDDFRKRAPVLHPCLVVKRECLAGGFDLSLDLAADFELMVRLVAESRAGRHVSGVGAFILSGGLSERRRLRARWQATRSLLRHSPSILFSLQVLVSHLRFILIHVIITKLIRPVPILRRYARSRSGGEPAGTFSAGNEELQASR